MRPGQRIPTGVQADRGSWAEPRYARPVPAVVRTLEEGGQRLTLRDLGTHHELLLGQVPILSSAALGTERVFGELSQQLDPGSPLRRVLVGGLGFGATLRGVLGVAPADAEVV